jgi:hypothetical protein
MAIKTKAQLKTYFETGDYPTQAQFADLIDSLLQVNDSIPISQVTNLQTTLNTLLQTAPITGQTDEDIEFTFTVDGIVRELWLWCGSNTTLTVRKNGDAGTDFEIELVANTPYLHRVDMPTMNGYTLELLGVSLWVAYKVYRA